MEEKAFKKYLKEKGFKFTKERELIFKEVFSRHGHFDLEELHMDMRKKGLKVSKASVYRTLPLLLESGLIEQVERTEKHAHYEQTSGLNHHDHMICISCGSVIEFYSESLERLQNRICKKEGFKGVTHTLEIKGYCGKCRKRRE
ncbi:MAG: transcriptional repressor [Nitrospira sp.]|nr:transcriptional repressor [Nitrospira sp.]